MESYDDDIEMSVTQPIRTITCETRNTTNNKSKTKY